MKFNLCLDGYPNNPDFTITNIFIENCVSFLCISLPYYFIFLLRHKHRPLDVQKDPVHKNRCHVQFPEVFSTTPYEVNVTAVNPLGEKSSFFSFEESTIGKMDVFHFLCRFHAARFFSLPFSPLCLKVTNALAWQ